MKTLTLWDELSTKHRHILIQKDIDFGDNYWRNLLKNPDMLINDIRINDWFLLENDLGFKSINEAYHNMFNNEA